LAAVEECAVHEILNGMAEIRILAHVGRIAAAELEARPQKRLNRRALDGPTASTDP